MIASRSCGERVAPQSHLYRARASSDKGVGQRRALWISIPKVEIGLGRELGTLDLHVEAIDFLGN